MSYSGAPQARQAREALGNALAALQEDPNIPQDVMAVAQNIAQSVGALFEAERASSEPDGKTCVRSALGSLSQTLALLQDVRGEHRGIALATEVIAKSMSTLYPLTTVPSKMPPAPSQHAPQAHAPIPQPPRAPSAPHPPPPAQGLSQVRPSQPQHAPPPPVAAGDRASVEANIGATTESNFFVGFSGEIAEGGVFVSTYEVLPRGTPVHVLITLPGGFETRLPGRVRFVRDPLDFGAESEPGMGVQFEQLPPQDRELILRFIRKRAPMFYDD
jgi:uncharacterized protein (TIGR02266 family)